jgi:hypothetical protein
LSGTPRGGEWEGKVAARGVLWNSMLQGSAPSQLGLSDP